MAAAQRQQTRCIWVISLLVAATVVESYKIEHPIYRPSPHAHGIKRSIHWPSTTTNPVPIQNEKQLLMSGALLRRGEFGSLAGSRVLEVDLECSEAGLTYNQVSIQ